MASASNGHPGEVGGDQAVDGDRVEQGVPEGEGEMTRQPRKNIWTTAEEDQLRSMVIAGNTINKIAKKLKRTSKAVRNKAYKMKLRLAYPRSTKPR